MNKYRVLKTYPKQITNSGRLITLRSNSSVYLKREPQVVRLVKLGFLKPIVELPKKVKKKPVKKAVESKPVEVREEKASKKSEYLNKKNKSNKSDSKE